MKTNKTMTLHGGPKHWAPMPGGLYKACDFTVPHTTEDGTKVTLTYRLSDREAEKKDQTAYFVCSSLDYYQTPARNMDKSEENDAVIDFGDRDLVDTQPND